MSFHETFGPEVALIIGIILVLAGLVLAMWGHGIWASIMSLLGALIGGAVGYIFGASLGGGLVGLILAIIGAIIGGIIFAKLVKVGLAFLVAFLAAALVYSLLQGSARFTGQVDPAFVVALVVLVAVFAISYHFIDELIGVITAAIGGLLLAAGLLFLGAGLIVAALAGLGAFALGALLQTAAIRRKRRARTFVPVAALPPPP